MNPIKKLDHYLLRHYPSIWVTRVHIFVPVGLSIAALLFLIPVLSGWTLKDELPSNVVPFFMMVVAIIIYLIWWLISQVRLKDLKSSRNQSLMESYIQFLSYILVFSTAFLMLVAIPLANYQKVRNAIDEETFQKDLEHLNLGNSLVNRRGHLSPYFSKTVIFDQVDFAYSYYDKYRYHGNDSIRVSIDEANQIISDYVTSYNKYTRDTLDRKTIPLFSYLIKPADVSKLSHTTEIFDTINTGEYTLTTDFINDCRPRSPYFYQDYIHLSETDVEDKISWITTGISLGWYFEFMFPWFWKLIFFGITGFSLLLWISKNVSLDRFIPGIIFICAVPIFFGLLERITSVLFDMKRENENLILFGIIIAMYLLFAVGIFIAYFNSKFHTAGSILSVQLQFFLPLLPFFIWAAFIFDRNSDFNGEYVAEILYWSAVVVSILSIVIFKPLYAKFRSLPSKN